MERRQFIRSVCAVAVLAAFPREKLHLVTMETWQEGEDNRWHHHATVTEDGHATFYVDGIKQCSKASQQSLYS